MLKKGALSPPSARKSPRRLGLGHASRAKQPLARTTPLSRNGTVHFSSSAPLHTGRIQSIRGGLRGGNSSSGSSPSSHLARPRPSPPSRVSVRLHRRPAVVLFPAQGPGPWPPTRKWPGVTPTPRCHDNAPPPAGLGPGKASALGRTPPPGSVEGVPKQGRHFAFQGGYGSRQGQSQLPLSLSLCHLQAKKRGEAPPLARRAARILLGYGLQFPEFLSLPCWMRISGS